MKKAVLLRIETELTDEQLQDSVVHVVCWDKGTDLSVPGAIEDAVSHPATLIAVSGDMDGHG